VGVDHVMVLFNIDRRVNFRPPESLVYKELIHHFVLDPWGLLKTVQTLPQLIDKLGILTISLRLVYVYILIKVPIQEGCLNIYLLHV
jgi:hypothetical protein